MPTIPLDTDIIGADAITLDRIRTQQQRNDIQSAIAYRAAEIAVMKAETAAILSPENALRAAVATAIAPKYFTTGPSTTAATQQADAQADAARFRAALDEAMRVLT